MNIKGILRIFILCFALQRRDVPVATGTTGPCQCLPLVRSYGSVSGAGTQPTVPGLTYGNSTPARISDWPWQLTPARPPYPPSLQEQTSDEHLSLQHCKHSFAFWCSCPAWARPEEMNRLFCSLFSRLQTLDASCGHYLRFVISMNWQTHRYQAVF